MQGSGDLYGNFRLCRIEPYSGHHYRLPPISSSAPAMPRNPERGSGKPGLNFCEKAEMRLDANDVVDCPWCHQGAVVSPLPGDPDICQHCGGFGLTLLHVRCYCGRQMNLTQQLDKGVFYCGRQTCGDAIKKALGIGVKKNAASHVDHRSTNRTGDLFQAST